MLSDEEKAAINRLYDVTHLTNGEHTEYIDINNIATEEEYLDSCEGFCKATDIVLNLIEKQSKEIEELKEDRKKYAEEYIHNNPWLYKQLNENYILRIESEQKEKKAYIDGTNIADKLCNKKWKDKIKAKIEEIDKAYEDSKNEDGESEYYYPNYTVEVLQSLLEKE